jgi:hypothetical protein
MIRGKYIMGIRVNIIAAKYDNLSVKDKIMPEIDQELQK